jgi:hypothetical protein
MIVAKSSGLTNFAVINISLIALVRQEEVIPSSFTTFNRVKRKYF